MDSFFNNKGFKGSKCKTLLKLTIPRIKLLRNRREIQLKQMRRDIAKLLETGQEATARIRVEHIIREEKMMAAHEIVELFCELIAVRLPIIETQKECPIDLKEAISSVCFAAPRCADLPELMQVQMLFAAKYGKEFVSRATELMPDCGVNRQLIELLSVRAPAPDVKLKLLKEIAEEHELDWDPSASENELLKPHEDLLNGPTHFVSGYKVPLPEEKHEEALHTVSEQASGEKSDSDVDLDSWEFPEVPKQQPLKVSTGNVSAPAMLPFPTSALPDGQLAKSTAIDEGRTEESCLKPEEVLQDKLVTKELESTKTSAEEKQYVPFISPPAESSPTGSVKQNISSPSSVSATKSETKHNQNIPSPSVSAAKSETKHNQNIPSPSVSAAKNETKQNQNIPTPSVSEAKSRAKQNQNIPTPFVSAAKGGANVDVDLQDLLATAQAAAETAERAAAAARTAASLAELKINEFAKSNNEVSDSNIENPFHADTEKPNLSEDHHLGHQSSLHNGENYLGPQILHVPSYEDAKAEYDSSNPSRYVPGQGSAGHQFQRLPSMEDEFSYPNLFSSQGSRAASRANSFADNSRSSHE